MCFVAQTCLILSLCYTLHTVSRGVGRCLHTFCQYSIAIQIGQHDKLLNYYYSLGVLTKCITIVNRNKINVSEKLKIGLNVFYLHVSWHTQYLHKLVTVLQVHRVDFKLTSINNIISHGFIIIVTLFKTIKSALDVIKASLVVSLSKCFWHLGFLDHFCS